MSDVYYFDDLQIGQRFVKQLRDLVNGGANTSRRI